MVSFLPPCGSIVQCCKWKTESGVNKTTCKQKGKKHKICQSAGKELRNNHQEHPSNHITHLKNPLEHLSNHITHLKTL